MIPVGPGESIQWQFVFFCYLVSIGEAPLATLTRRRRDRQAPLGSLGLRLYRESGEVHRDKQSLGRGGMAQSTEAQGGALAALIKDGY